MSQAAVGRSESEARLPFYVLMSTVCLGVAVLGFMPTFFLPLARGTFVRPPVIYIHGLLFFGWTVYFCAQSWLAAKGRTLAHREWGVLGAALGAAMAFSVISVLVVQLNRVPPEPGAASFAWVNVASITYFATCLALALANTRRPGIHKRLLLLGTLSLLDAPIARWGGILFGGYHGPPRSFLEAYWPNLVVVALMLIPIVHDRRSPSRVYLVGVPLYAVVNLTPSLVWNTQAWLSIAGAIKHLGG